MRRFRPFRRVEIVVAGAVVLFFLGAVGVSRAGVVGSRHDFTNSNGKPLDKGGVCSPCHSPHYSPEARGNWARDLSDERNYFDQTSSPDYVPGTTLLCYDCHDDNPTTVAAAVDNDPPRGTPPLGSWNSLFEPQDIAFGYSYNPAAPYNIIPDDTLAQGGTKTGYYELVNGDVPGGPTPMPDTTPVPAAPTGGHYWKQDPSGTPDLYTSGDKIPCSLCHDPHNARTGSNEAFFLTETTFAGGTVTLGNGLRASNKDDTTNLNRSRNGTGPLGTGTGNGREMCAVCHSYSNSGSPKTIGGRTLPSPPLKISQHRSSNSTACTKCHPHNKVQASCNDCHGFPPLLTRADAGNELFLRDDPVRKHAENYEGGAGAHQRHKDALGDTIFQCEICHGPNPGSATWHNEGGGVIADGSNVNIMGLDTFWSPPGYPGSLTPAYNSDSDRVPDPGDTAYVFSSKGGGQRVCSGVACHGNPPPSGANVLNWDDDMIDGDVPEPAKAGEIQICKWCHDATPAMIFVGTDPFDAGQKGASSNYAYGANVLGNGLATAAGFGAEVNGHGVGLAGAVKAVYDKDAVNDAAGAAGAAKECTVCHDAAYVAAPAPNHPQRTHFPAIHGAASDPRDAMRLRDTINSGPANIGTSATFPTGPDQACLACHQNGVNTAADGLDVSHHGIPPQPPPSGGYDPSEDDPAFTRSCRQCHDVHGSNWNGTGRNLNMVGKWLDVNGDRTPNAADGAYVDSNVVPAAPTLAAITTADNAVVFTATTGADSFDENDGAYDTTGAADRDDICATCHAPATGSGVGTGGGSHDGLALPIGEMRGQNCMTCHDHDYDNNSSTIDAFMPSGCNGCHGRAIANGADTQGDPAYNGQYWPDGIPPVNPLYVYADDDPGAHYRHVQALALQLYGETPAVVVTDTGKGTTYTKQKTICAFCHNDPGGVDPEGGAHTRNDSAVRDPLDRVTVYLDSDDTGARTDVFRRLTVGAGAAGLEIANGINGDQRYNYTGMNCTNLTCHNQTATPTAASVPPGTWNAPPVWTAANASCSNLACHATTTYTIAHNTHVNGSPKSYACTECHPDNATVVPVTNPIPLAHGNGEVDMKWDNVGSLEGAHGGDGYYDKNNNTVGDAAPGDTGFGYKTGNAVPADPTQYARACYLVYCHGGDNDNNVPTSLPDWGGSTTSPSPFWNAAGPLACTICHASAPTTARHIVHDNNNAWVPNECGTCHLANNNKTSMAGFAATHVNGSVNMAPAVPYTPPTCTNVCHLVSAATGDWLDTDPLACTDCHSGTYIGTPPTSGLHAATTAMAHDVLFMATAGESPETATCTHCHLSAGPSSTHKTGSAGVAPPTQNSTETTYSFDATYVVSYSSAGGCQATCHSDNQVVDTVPAGLPASPWRRKWIGVVDAKPADTNNPGDGVCGNCHGDFVNSWRVNDADQTGTSHTNPYDQDPGPGNPDLMSRHSVCQTCHGWGYAGYDRAWGGTAPGHGDGSITMNGPAAPPAAKTGAEYNNATGGCEAACHSPAYVMNTNSGWAVNYGDFGSGACELCHNSSPHVGCDELPGTADDAPNVMGPGTNASGTGTTPKPYDDGLYGYNVNGHGANGTAVNRPTVALNPNRDCIDCHDITDPPNTHFYCPNPPPTPGVLSTRFYYGKSADTRNANTSHLVAGFLAGADNPQAKQIGFDNYCYTTCHATDPGPVMDMRHGTKVAGVYDNIMQFNVANDTTDDPKQDRGADNVWTPWTIDDLTTLVDASPPGVRHHGVCVSCHDPHGTATTQKTRLTNKMVIRNWKGTSMQPFCGSNCHRLP